MLLAVLKSLKMKETYSEKFKSLFLTVAFEPTSRWTDRDLAFWTSPTLQHIVVHKLYFETLLPRKMTTLKFLWPVHHTLSQIHNRFHRVYVYSNYLTVETACAMNPYACYIKDATLVSCLVHSVGLKKFGLNFDGNVGAYCLEYDGWYRQYNLR